MKLYVISENDYDAGRAEGVYSSVEIAVASIADERRSYLIDEFDLDAPTSLGRTVARVVGGKLVHGLTV